MNTQQNFYSTDLAGHIPHHKTGRRKVEEVPGFVLAAGGVNEIDPGPFDPSALRPSEQTQAQLVSRLVSMNAEYCAYVESLPKGERWTYNQLMTLARLWDLMELEHSLCDAATVRLLEGLHDVNPSPTTGPVVGRYSEFSLLPDGHGMI